MVNKIILITGASSGIGKETALTLAKQGHTVIIHGRDEAKTKAVFEEIQKETGNKNLDMMTADLSLMSEVTKFADQIKTKYDRLDVLINNAGGQFGFQREVTAEGREKTMAINLFAPFLLTYLLLDVLKKSPSPRVVTVASESYRQGGKPFLHDIELADNYSFTRVYGLSKLYAFWVMRYFAKAYPDIAFNTVDPGSVDTDLGRVSAKSGVGRLVYNLWKPMMQSVQKGAGTSIYMATSSDVEGITGKFYGNCKEKNIKPKWLSAEGEKTVWNYCMKICKPYME